METEAKEKEVEAYCVKCKEKRMMQNPEKTEIKKKGGGTRPAMKGTCPVCGTGMFKILSMKEAEQ